MQKLFLIIAFSSLFIACSKTESTKTSYKNSESANSIEKNANTNINPFYSIVATTFPCYDAARAILGDYCNKQISLNLLVKPGIEVHSFDPTPTDIISIQKSDLFIFIGGESDEWIYNFIDKKNTELQTQKNTLKLMDFVEKLPEAENPNENDEHIWTSPKNELKIIDVVHDAICQLDIEKNNSQFLDQFEINKNSYQEKISSTVYKTAKVLASKNQKFIVMADRFPLAYFANYYKLEYIAAFPGCSTAVEASSFTISKLIDEVKSRELPAVFYIELGNHKIADAIAESTNTKTILLQSCQNVTKKDFDAGETWVSLMEKNAIALDKGLQ